MEQQTAPVKKQRILSGIQPSGTPTLGNYIGAMRNWKLLEDQYDCLYMIADLHAITVRQTPAELRRRSRETMALLIACGIDPEKNVMFAFSLSAGHRESSRIVSIDLKKITIGQLRTSPSNKALIDEIFAGTRYKVVYQPNMGDYLLCHAAFVTPAAFACYKTDGNLKKLKGNTAYLRKMVDANIEAYRAIRDAGHEILPDADKAFESDKYRKVCLRFFKLMAATSLGKVCASDHAMSATDEMSALNRDLKQFFDANGADYPVWRALEKECGKYLK